MEPGVSQCKRRIEGTQFLDQFLQFDPCMPTPDFPAPLCNGVAELVQLQKMVFGLHELRPRVTIALNANVFVIR